MYRLLLLLLVALAIAPFAWKHLKQRKPTSITHKTQVNETTDAALVRLQGVANRMEKYAKENGYNTRYCFLIDMKVACGSNRFFVFDNKKDSVIESGLVTHGYGNSTFSKVSFSNVPGSNCSSLGKYKIGRSYNGRFGLAYKLHGLDKTNNKAFERFVVLHSHFCVPAIEVSPLPICMSQGCPTVAPSFLKTLATYIDGADKPILLLIFD